MIIRYDKKGRVLSCTADEWAGEPGEGAPEGERLLRVADEKLPEDFLSTFALGKYRVSRGKVVESKNYQPPEPVSFKPAVTAGKLLAAAKRKRKRKQDTE